MRKLGWIPADRTGPIETLRHLLEFFGVASFEALDQIDTDLCTSFRQSMAHRVNRTAVLAWLRQGEIKAQRQLTHPYDKEKFARALTGIRPLTRLPFVDALQKATALCNAAGVAVVFVPELPGTVVSGATRWLNAHKAVIQFSLRGKTDDKFWFTFFHEAAHILMHPKKGIFLELDKTVDSQEAEADRFASETLIPMTLWQLLATLEPRSARDVTQFAETYGLAPGSVVGRLQIEGKLPWSHLNRLKVKLEPLEPL